MALSLLQAALEADPSVEKVPCVAGHTFATDTNSKSVIETEQ